MPYDVFLSHSSSDKSAVRELAQALRERDLNPWLDEDELIPGRRWQKALEDIILSTKAVAVLIGPNGLGPWHEREMEACLRRCAREELPIIPVLLPGAPKEPKLPMFLDAFTWVDMRGGFSAVELARLEWGITGNKPVDAMGVPPTRRRYNNVIADELARAVKRREELEKLGADTTTVREEILSLKRKLRDGGQLKAGDILRHGESERYVLLSKIGQGGFATVWKARDRIASEDVAIKILHGQHTQDRTLRERFFRGAQIMHMLKHAAIVPVLVPCAEDGGFQYFTMALMRGGDLNAAVINGQVNREDIVPLILNVATGLSVAHRAELVHRDVKPSNILLDSQGGPRLTDFDLVTGAHTTGGTGSGAMGTVVYSAPELLQRPQEADARADVYSLAMTMVFALRGSPIPSDIVRGPDRVLALLECNDAIKAVIRRALSWEPELRHPSMSEFVRALVNANRLPELARTSIQLPQLSYSGQSSETFLLNLEATRLRQEADKLLKQVRSFDPVHLKKPAWALQDRAQKLLLDAAVSEERWLHTRRIAAPNSALARRQLADYYRKLHVLSVRNRDLERAARAEEMLKIYDHGEHQVYLAKTGSLTLVTAPAGARVIAFRYTAKHRRLRPVRIGELGHTPLVRVPIESGSYLLEIRTSGYQRVRYPIRIESGEHWIDIRPGNDQPSAIVLPPLGTLGRDDVYIPAGWFLAGGDPDAVESLPAQRVWIDGVVMRRHPVTRGQYLVFLNDLIAQGREVESMCHAPKLPNRTTGDLAWPRNAEGLFELDPTWPEEHQNRWPVTLVDWNDACAYAEWASATSGLPWRLPSEFEWEKAARGTDGRLLPWGDFFEPTFSCVLDSHDEPLSPRPVDTRRFRHDKSPYGVCGMAGNVREWCLDGYKRKGPELRQGLLQVTPPDSNDLMLRSARGGAWTSTFTRGRPACRFAGRPDFVFRGLGFRLCRSI